MVKILLLTGPAASGKTTISKLLQDQFNFLWLDCDKIDSQFLPQGLHYLPENSPKLKEAHKTIFNAIEENKDSHKPIVLDYIIFGLYKEFLQKLKKLYPSAVIKVLFPTEEEMIRRDLERECWTAGAKRIKEVAQDFESLKSFIGTENYLDTTGQTPSQTISYLLTELPGLF